MLNRKIAKDVDYFTTSGAMALANIIEAYWWNRGHDEVVAWIEEISTSVPIGNDDRKPGRPTNESKERFAVRSNLVNGLPPRVAYAMKKAA